MSNPRAAVRTVRGDEITTGDGQFYNRHCIRDPWFSVYSTGGSRRTSVYGPGSRRDRSVAILPALKGKRVRPLVPYPLCYSFTFPVTVSPRI